MALPLSIQELHEISSRLGRRSAHLRRRSARLRSRADRLRRDGGGGMFPACPRCGALLRPGDDLTAAAGSLIHARCPASV
jgi:hypothetical protein